MECLMEKVLSSGKMELFTKESLETTKLQVKDYTNSLMDQNIKEVLEMVLEMDLENIPMMLKVMFMMEIGKMDLGMDSVNLIIKIIHFIKDNGNKVLNLEKENINILQVTIIKANGKTIWGMDGEWWIGLIQIKNIKEIGFQIIKMDLEHIFGYNNLNKEDFLEIVMLAFGRMEWDMDLEYSFTLMEVNTKVTGKIIWKMDKDNLHTKMEINIKDIFIKIEWLINRNLEQLQ